MFVVEDMVAAVAVLPLALRAVSKVHIGVGLVSDSADRTAVKMLFSAPGSRQGFFRHLPSAIFEVRDDITCKEDEEISN